MGIWLFAILLTINAPQLSSNEDALDHYILAHEQGENGELEKALANYIKAYTLYGSGDNKNRARILVEIGVIFYDIDSYSKALKFYTLANELHEPIKRYTLFNLGMCHSRMGDYERALDFLEMNLELANENADELQITKTYIELGIVSYEAGDYEGARYYAELAEKRTKEDSSSSELYAGALNNIANAYLAQNNIASAKHKFLSCLNYYKESGVEKYMGHTLNNLGKVYRKLSMNDSAFYYFDLAWRHNALTKYIDETEISLTNLDEMFLEIGDKDSALFYTKELVDLFRINGETTQEFDRIALTQRLQSILETSLVIEGDTENGVAIRNSIYGFTLLVVAGVSFVVWYSRKARRQN